jgi:hypothetical protein
MTEVEKATDESYIENTANFDFLPELKTPYPAPEDRSGESRSIWTRSTTHPTLAHAACYRPSENSRVALVADNTACPRYVPGVPRQH